MSVTSPPLHLHLWHYLGNTAVYVPLQHIAQAGTGEMLYWFHHRVYLPERVKWPAFVTRQSASCNIVDLPTAAATRDLQGYHRWFVLRYGAEEHRFLAGYTEHAPAPSPVQVHSRWRTWCFYLQTCGHIVHSHYTDMRQWMSRG